MSSAGGTESGIEWLPWSPVAFARARELRRPILLSIHAAWSRGCREMDGSTYADPFVAALVRDRFMPVRVDADERPDVAARYELCGLPTTVFLLADGRVLGGGTFIDAERLRAVLPKVAEAAVGAATRSAPPRDPEVSAALDDAALCEHVFSSFDAVHAGFGSAPKFPHIAAVRLALDLYAETADATMLERAARTLDVMGWGQLSDEEDGAFYRCCAAADWTSPHPEKLLSVNASLVRLYLHAGERTSTERWFARAADGISFLERRLRRRDGTWRTAADLDASRVLSDANSAASSAMLHAARLFGDNELLERGIEGLEHVLLGCYKPGEGVAHRAGGARGLLTDQVAMAGACLDASEATGNVTYLMLAEELARYTVRVMRDPADGAFLDRSPAAYADEPPGAAGPLKPFVVNCEAAVVLGRLAEASGNESFSDLARDTLRALDLRAASNGVDAAHYLLARRAVLR